MKTVLEIGRYSENSDLLLIELGQEFCCYAFLDSKKKSFDQIKYLAFDSLANSDELNALMQELKGDKKHRVVLCSAYAQALLVPQQYFEGSYALMDHLYDLPDQSNFNDSIPEWQMVATYSMPRAIYEMIRESFPSVQCFHAYTPCLKIYNGFVAPDQIDLHFSTQDFRVLVKREQQVLLAQTYEYKTPLDVVYFLLKICYEFKLDQSGTFLIISGLIDQDSALYTELHSYFGNIHFAHSPSYVLPDNDHPHYYFNSLYNLAACAS